MNLLKKNDKFHIKVNTSMKNILDNNKNKYIFIDIFYLIIQ
jgi:hypothetical protein